MLISSRRDLLKTLALAGAGTALRAQSAAGRIDVHHHFTPPFYLKAMEKELAGSGFTARPWSPALSLEAMDKNGVAAALLSPVQRLVMDSMSDRSERARTLARQSNEFGAQVVRDNPRRFGLLAALPLPDTEGSLREIEYAYDTLKADGIALWTSYLDKWPGDPSFDRVWEELNRRRAIVFFHPATPSLRRNLIPGLAISGIIEYDLDTARAAESMLVNRIHEVPRHSFHLFALRRSAAGAGRAHHRRSAPRLKRPDPAARHRRIQEVLLRNRARLETSGTRCVERCRSGIADSVWQRRADPRV